MDITAHIPDHAALLEALLEGFIQAATIEIQSGVVPPFPWDAPHVQYQEEPAGRELWQLPHETIQLGSGDCEDFVIWAAAGYRATGEDEGARARIVRTSHVDALHCLLERSDGSFEDPSMPMYRYALGADYGHVIDHRSASPPPPTPGMARAAAQAQAQPNPYAQFRAAADAQMKQAGTNQMVFFSSDAARQAEGGAGGVLAPGSLEYNMQQGVISPGVLPGLSDSATAKMTALNYAQQFEQAAPDLLSFGKSRGRSVPTAADLFNAGLTDAQGNPVYGPGGVPTGAIPGAGPNPYGPYGPNPYSPYGANPYYGSPYGAYGGSQYGVDPNGAMMYPYSPQGTMPYYGSQYGQFGYSMPFTTDDYDSPYGWAGGSAGLMTYGDIDQDAQDFGLDYSGDDVMQMLGAY